MGKKLGFCSKITRTCSYGLTFEPRISIMKMLIFFMQALLIHFELCLFGSFMVGCLTLSWRIFLSCRNQSIDLTGFYFLGTSFMKKSISDVIGLWIFFLKQHQLIKRQSCHHKETRENQLTSFYVMATFAFNELSTLKAFWIIFKCAIAV